MNYYGAEDTLEEFLPPMAAAVKYARSLPGVEKVVFATHSGGGPVLTFYEEIAEKGPAACQEASRLYPCRAEGLTGLPKVDGLLLLDINIGAPHRMLSLDPAVETAQPTKREASLDLYAPQNGFDPATNTAQYPPAFVKRYLAGFHARGERLIADAQARLRAIKAGHGPYKDDEPFVIAGMAGNAVGARLNMADPRLLSRTHAPHLHLKADGTTPVEIVRSTRKPEATSAEDRDTLAETTQNVTVRHFLSFLALRTTPEFELTEDSIKGFDWRSSANSSPGQCRERHRAHAGDGGDVCDSPRPSRNHLRPFGGRGQGVRGGRRRQPRVSSVPAGIRRHAKAHVRLRRSLAEQAWSVLTPQFTWIVRCRVVAMRRFGPKAAMFERIARRWRQTIGPKFRDATRFCEEHSMSTLSWSGRVVAVLTFCVSLIAGTTSALAQGTSAAGIAGVAKDASGGVLPGVSVEVSSPALIEKVRTTVTDERGQYQITELRPGTYTVTFTLSGFATLVKDGLQLTSSFTATVNAELKVGELSETLTVSGQSPLVDVTKVTQQKVITTEELSIIPTAKSTLSLIALMPAAAAPPSAQDVGGSRGEASVRMSIHGARQADQRMQQNGMSYNMLDNPNGRTFFINPLGAEEIVVEAGSGGSAEYSTGGAQVNIISRDGGDRFMGTFFLAGTSHGLQADNLTDDLQDQRPHVGEQHPLDLRHQRRCRRPHRAQQAVVHHGASTEWPQGENRQPVLRLEPIGLGVHA